MSEDKTYTKIWRKFNKITPWHDDAFRCRKKHYSTDPKFNNPLELEGIVNNEPFEIYSVKGRKLKYSKYVAPNGKVFVKIVNPPKFMEVYSCPVKPVVDNHHSTEKIFSENLKGVKVLGYMTDE